MWSRACVFSTTLLLPSTATHAVWIQNAAATSEKQKTPACIREIQGHKHWTKVYSQKAMLSVPRFCPCACHLHTTSAAWRCVLNGTWSGSRAASDQKINCGGRIQEFRAQLRMVLTLLASSFSSSSSSFNCFVVIEWFVCVCVCVCLSLCLCLSVWFLLLLVFVVVAVLLLFKDVFCLILIVVLLCFYYSCWKQGMGDGVTVACSVWTIWYIVHVTV